MYLIMLLIMARKSGRRSDSKRGNDRCDVCLIMSNPDNAVVYKEIYLPHYKYAKDRFSDVWLLRGFGLKKYRTDED